MGDQEQLPAIFHSPHNWKGNEELALLQACEHYGFGNWEDIAQKMGTRTAEECMQHYSGMYIFGKIGQATWEGKEPNAIADKTAGFEMPFSPSSPLPESTLQEFQQEMGFMPYRNDFETENDNDAESLVCNLSTSAEDDDLDISIKLFHVDVYCRKLQERNRRKHIVQEYNLVSRYQENKLKPAAAKKKSKEDRDFGSIKSFCQLLSCSEYEQLLDNLRREKELKQRVKELSRYRRNGLTRLEECAEFDAARLKREKRRENNVLNNNTKKKPSPFGARRAAGTKKHPEDKMSDSSSQDERGEEEDSKAFDLSALPGYCLLSEMEKKLCTAIRLKPAHYITFKTVLIRDHLDRQRGLAVKAKFPAGLDKAHRRRIINFLVSNGWISGS